MYERNSNVLGNGTLMKSDMFPRIGFRFNKEKKHPTDKLACNHNYQAADADYVDFEAVVSTSSDQQAFAPGELVTEWNEGDRNFYQFKTDHKIKFAMAFNSGTFETLNDEWEGIPVTAYHHNGHEHNLDNHFRGVKAALAYNTKYFGAYWHNDVRIIEFPSSEGTYATVFGNNVLMSETRYVTGEGDNSMNIDFYVPAHELTHHWWGNQLMPADAQGAQMLTESITEYISMQIFKDEYGEERMIDLAKMQRLRYLRGLGSERAGENPLILLKPNQTYLSYGKGALSFHTLSHYWGEENLNASLKSFMNKFRGKQTYPTSIDLTAHLKLEMPDSLTYLIEDYFEKIVMHETTVKDVNCVKEGDAKFKINVGLSVTKKERNTEVKQDDEQYHEIQTNDYVQVGFYDEFGKLIETRTIHVSATDVSSSFRLDWKPASVKVDPNVLLIERNRDDNVMVVE